MVRVLWCKVGLLYILAVALLIWTAPLEKPLPQRVELFYLRQILS